MAKTFCTECGSPSLPSDRFCTGCGNDLAAQTSPGEQAPVAMSIEVKETRNSRLPLVVGAIATALVLVGLGAVLVTRTDNTPVVSRSAPPRIEVPSSSPQATKPAVPRRAATRAAQPVVTVTRAAPEPGPTSASAVSSEPPADTSGPEAALALTKGQARSQLAQVRSQDLSRLDALYYSWVPQLSSKCEGWTVDVKPDWSPDGVAETKNVSAQQILAFHTALAQRYDAVLVKDTDIGRGGSPQCEGSIWLALGSQTFSSGSAANRWCDRQGFPVGECYARRVVPAGEPGGHSKQRD